MVDKSISSKKFSSFANKNLFFCQEDPFTCQKCKKFGEEFYCETESTIAECGNLTLDFIKNESIGLYAGKQKSKEFLIVPVTSIFKKIKPFHISGKKVCSQLNYYFFFYKRFLASVPET